MSPFFQRHPCQNMTFGLGPDPLEPMPPLSDRTVLAEHQPHVAIQAPHQIDGPSRLPRAWNGKVGKALNTFLFSFQRPTEGFKLMEKRNWFSDRWRRVSSGIAYRRSQQFPS